MKCLIRICLIYQMRAINPSATIPTRNSSENGPPVKYYYWPFQGCASSVDRLIYFLSCLSHAFVRVCFLMPCGHLLGKGWPLGSHFWRIMVKLSLSHWYPGSRCGAWLYRFLIFAPFLTLGLWAWVKYMYMSFSIETTMHRYNESCGKEAKDDRYQRTSRDGHPSK